MQREDGFQLIEIVIALAVVGLFAGLAVPDLLRATARDRVILAASEVCAAMRLARAEAMRHGRNVGLQFVTEGDGKVSYTLYRDEDGDGVLTADIRSGVDIPLGPPRLLAHLGPEVGFGILHTTPAPRDPGDPGKRLDHLDDPIRFNNSNIAAVSSWGSSTPGTVYVTDHREHMAAVRVLGASGRLRLLVYDREHQRWQRP